MEGLLILLQSHLKQRYSKSGLDLDYLFVATKTKIIIHGPDRNPLGDTDIVAEITSPEGNKEVAISFTRGTAFDQALLKRVVEEALHIDTVVIVTS